MSQLLHNQARADFNQLMVTEGVALLVTPQELSLEPIVTRGFFVPNALESPSAGYNRKLSGKHHEVTLALDLMQDYTPRNEDQVTLGEQTYTVHHVDFPDEMKIVLAVR